MYVINHPNTRTICVSDEIVRWQWDILFSIGRSYCYRDHLSTLLEELPDGAHKNAVLQTHNTMFSMFLVDWCKLFGANNNEIHWKKAHLKHRTLGGSQVCTKEQYLTIVRQFILDHAEITKNENQAAYNAMTDSRNKYAAHINPHDMPAMPYLETPYKIAKGYYAFLFAVEGVAKQPWGDLERQFTAEATEAFPSQR